MQISKTVKHLFVYLSLLIVIVVAMVGGLVITKSSPQKSDTAQVPAIVRPNNSNSNQSSPSTGICTLPNVYTSLPAKCRTADGKFIQGDWSAPTFLIPYELK